MTERDERMYVLASAKTRLQCISELIRELTVELDDERTSKAHALVKGARQNLATALELIFETIKKEHR